jgi:hypothetical protein
VQGHCIQAVKDKALEILAAAPRVHPDAITRMVGKHCAACAVLCCAAAHALGRARCAVGGGAAALCCALWELLSACRQLAEPGCSHRTCPDRPISDHPPLPPCLQAFVGYRDFYGETGDGHFVVHDFVDSKSFRQACLLLCGRGCSRMRQEVCLWKSFQSM